MKKFYDLDTLELKQLIILPPRITKSFFEHFLSFYLAKIKVLHKKKSSYNIWLLVWGWCLPMRHQELQICAFSSLGWIQSLSSNQTSALLLQDIVDTFPKTKLVLINKLIYLHDYSDYFSPPKRQ